MHFQRITLGAALLCTVAAIPCSELGFVASETDLMQGIVDSPYDPFDPQGRWEVVKANDCLVRFHTYDAGQDPHSARVTETRWAATPSAVRHTMNHYGGSPGNIMLWLPLTSKAFQYANILPRFISNDHEQVTGQSSIRRERTVLSIILPSGKAKLTEVGPSAPEQEESNENIIQAQSVGAHGVKGTISTDDYAYSHTLIAQYLMRSINWVQLDAYFRRIPEPALPYAWIAAEKANPNECVIIDFRDFISFKIRI
ncbi:uncharacterized protein FIESC28_05434 [Fusarium coffeatum]|uniref:Uncharacterized protein n=1 Tax=Fusarium coffeatum TaxID=231269 RepID=A0A366RV03_9HYPO|nr:uncharacterized protein FIESC28_05434 [Fusarium coffeatum]RBR20155.1 hypothetical protein FIESC28_05434 [Fusarium coffeatum]